MRSLGKKDLRNIHVLEAMLFAFAHNASFSALNMNEEEHCLIEAMRTKQTASSRTFVLVCAVGAIVKLKEPK